jgi:hypothetical protein
LRTPAQHLHYSHTRGYQGYHTKEFQKDLELNKVLQNQRRSFLKKIKVCVERLMWEKGKHLYTHAVKNIEREINKHIPGSLMNSEFRTNRKNLPSWAQTFWKEKKVKDQKMSEAPLK